ncbi:MAG: acyl-CoA dehydrogenase family protein, partial [Xanthobacteraceae bacterium]
MTAAAADPRAQSFAANGFRLSEEQEEILTTSDRFAQAEFWPLQKRMDDEEWWPPEAMPALARIGFLGVTAPTQLGGAGGDFFTSG